MGRDKVRKKVLIAKPGLDGHDRGAKIIVRLLRDAGLEVVYTGIRQTPYEIVKAAVEEDADLIGLSSLSGAHETLFVDILELLKKNLLTVPVIAGGIIPEEDIPSLKSAGIREVFTSGTSLEEIKRRILEMLSL